MKNRAQVVEGLKALLDRDATYSGGVVSFTFQSHADAMKAVREARSALDEIGKVGRRLHPVFSNIVGARFSRLTVLSLSNSPEDKFLHVFVRCDCGTEKRIEARSLTRTRKPVRSCGCLKRDAARQMMRDRHRSAW